METITTLATVPAVLALVNLAKQFGLRGKWATLTAVLLGILLACAQTYLPAGILTTLTTGLTLGLGAAGLYDLTPTPTSSAKTLGKHEAQ